MAINLKKGQNVELTRNNPNLSKILVGLGWDVNKYDGGYDFDLDTSVFMLDKDSKAPQESDFIFYSNLTHPTGSVVHLGDNLTGLGSGDDEQIRVNLSLIPDNITQIAFAVTIYDGDMRKQNFGQVSNAYIRIIDESNGIELLRYDLCEEFSIETAVVVGLLFKQNTIWNFRALSNGFSGGLGAICHNFGLNAG